MMGIPEGGRLPAVRPQLLCGHGVGALVHVVPNGGGPAGLWKLAVLTFVQAELGEGHRAYKPGRRRRD